MRETVWENWPEHEGPYVNWWWHADGNLPANARDFEPARFDPYTFARHLEAIRMPELLGDEPAYIASYKPETGLHYPHDSIKIRDDEYGKGVMVPIPKGSSNPGWSDVLGDWTPEKVVNRLPELTRDDTVIVGVIDTGIALGHRSFRHADGTSRVIAAWQQTATFNQKQEYLPFGEEWYAGDIVEKLRHFSRNGDLMDRLDEDAFNRAMRLVEPHRIRGHRDLDHRAAHGTHVMDLAAGFDPKHVNAERVRMIVVNLPPQYLHGSAGNFLTYFAAYAVERIFDIADALWRKNNRGKDGNYPLALNLSYGMMAGPKDGTMSLETLIENLVSKRKKVPTSVCLPSGNENLARSVARVTLKKDTWSKPIPWRTLPSDRTSNFVEFWFDHPDERSVEDLDKYRFRITAPNGWRAEISSARDKHFTGLEEVGARIYCSTSTHGKVLFMLATAPTLILEGSGAPRPSPAGLWRISVATPYDARLLAFVQSDQSATTSSLAGLRSYFDHSDYEPYLPSGRMRDSFSYAHPGAPQELENADAMVTRKFTQNALATNVSTSSIGGYRARDGQPATYSATGARLNSHGVGPIQAAYQTDDGPAHYGILAAGARDGTSVAFRGTSMAAAQATRRAAEAMLDWLDCGKPASTPVVGSVGWHEKVASEAESLQVNFADAASEKIGAGRVGMAHGHRAGRPTRRGA